jgi:hypothetical protein
MSVQRVFFERNVVSVHLFIAIAIVEGWLGLSDVLIQRTASMLKNWPRLSLGAARALVLSCILLGIPWGGVKWAYDASVELRNQATRWVNEHLSPGTVVLVDTKLNLDLRTLDGSFKAKLSDGPSDFARHTGPNGKTVAIVRTSNADEYLKAVAGSKVAQRFRRRSLVSPDRGFDRRSAITIVRF